MQEIVLDLETTGLEPKHGHKIVEIGAIKLDKNRNMTREVFHQYVNPQRSMPQEAYNIHGIDDGMLADKPIFAVVADSFVEFIKDSILIIHNASFDIKFLNHELKLLGKPSINAVNVIDTLRMAQNIYPGKKASLDTLCNRFKIDLSDRKLHGALKDAKLLAQVYFFMVGGAVQYSLEVNQNLEDMKSIANHQAKFSTKVIKPTADELQEHLKLVRKMQNSIWATKGEDM
jgi:DNA polymerase-3 subunit epsilon